MLGAEICNFLLTIIVFGGSKVLLWEDGWSAGRAVAGGIGTKTNSAQVRLEFEFGLRLAKNLEKKILVKKLSILSYVRLPKT